MARRQPTRLRPVVSTDGDTTTIDTGIYRRTIKEVERKTPITVKVAGASFAARTHKSEAEMRADAEAWNAEPTRTVKLIRQQAARIYGEFAIEVVDMNRPPLRTGMQRHDLGNGLRTYQLPDDAPPIARDAGEVLECAFLVEADGTAPPYRIFYALKLGRVYERMLVRHLEHRALVGLRKAKRNRDNNAKKSAATKPKVEARRQAIYAELKRQKRNHEGQSVRRAIIAVATKTGDGQRTLWTAWSAGKK